MRGLVFMLCGVVRGMYAGTKVSALAIRSEYCIRER
jgi:hypothetical protein